MFFDPARFDGTPPPGTASVIPLTSALPPITDGVIVDGGSEICEVSTGVPKPCVQVAGRENQITFRVAAGGDGTGLRRLSLAGAGGSEVFGTLVNGKAVQFDDEVTGGAVKGSWIGLPLNQTTGAGVPNAYGVEVLGDEIEVGGTSAADRNIFSFNSVAGVKVSGDANETVIRGNDFGVAADSQTDKFNSTDAIEVSGLDPDWVGPQPARVPTNTVIGGNVPATNQDTRCDESCNSIVNSSHNAIDLDGDEQLGVQSGRSNARRRHLRGGQVHRAEAAQRCERQRW